MKKKMNNIKKIVSGILIAAMTLTMPAGVLGDDDQINRNNAAEGAAEIALPESGETNAGDAAGTSDGAGILSAASDAEGAGTDAAGTDAAGTDAAGTDTSGTDTAGTDTAGTDAEEAVIPEGTGDEETAAEQPDYEADVEDQAHWEETIPKKLAHVEKAKAGEEVREEDYRSDMVSIARSQVGYQESEKNFIINEDGTKSSYTRYGSWYGKDAYDDPWDADFVDFVMWYSGIEEDQSFDEAYLFSRIPQTAYNEKNELVVPADPNNADLLKHITGADEMTEEELLAAAKARASKASVPYDNNTVLWSWKLAKDERLYPSSYEAKAGDIVFLKEENGTFHTGVVTDRYKVKEIRDGVEVEIEKIVVAEATVGEQRDYVKEYEVETADKRIWAYGVVVDENTAHSDKEESQTSEDRQSDEKIKATDASVVESGTWENGENGSGTWEIDSSGVLTISGTGAMVDYNGVTSTPWYKYINKNSGSTVFATKLVFDGITKIGNNSFTRPYYVEEINAAGCTSLTTIGESALKQSSFTGGSPNNPNNPKTVDFSGCSSLSGIEKNALNTCNGIQYLDISDTLFNNSQLTTNNTAGFAASKAGMVTLKANNCSNITGTLDLSGFTSLTTVELSGCANLTGLKLPAGVTTLNVSGSGLTSLNVSGCTGLTTLDVSGCTGIASLTVPTSVTTLNVSGTGLTSLDVSACTGLASLDVSGCASLTSLNVPASVTTLNASGTGITGLDLSACTALADLNVSGCAGITGLDLSACAGLAGLNVSGCTGLTGLTVPDSVTTLDLTGCTGLATLDLSGCAGLTELTVPESVTALDISGCTGVDTLDLSSCTGLTTVTLGNRDDLTDLSWLTLPASVTTLDASGFTSLTSINVPDSVTSLNLSGCTGLTALDLSGTSLTDINVSNNDSLTALKLPASVTTLNVNNCPNLVIYFDGTSEEFAAFSQTLNLPDGTKTICWGEYTYTIARDSTVTLDEIISACEIPYITSNDVDSISVSDTSILEVVGLSLKNLKGFTASQKLTITLKNSLSGEITVDCAPLQESDNLNEFVNDDTVFSYEGETDTHPLSSAAIIKQGDALDLNLSFSEIPVGQDGERQMTLPGTMSYTFPEGLKVVEESLPEKVTINVPVEGAEVYVQASLSFNAETRVLTVEGNMEGSVESVKESVRGSSTAYFNIPVKVRPADVPGEYPLGNNKTLSTANAHNAKVSIASEQYDSTDGTIQYTVTVEAENDLDYDGKEYPVTISDLTTGDSAVLSFVSGTYTYAHKEGFVLPDGGSASQVNGADAPAEATAFTGFPLNVAHMYEGDTITLTYKAQPQKGTYTGSDQAEIQNMATITSDSPSNIPDDDTASVTNTVPYTPLVREYLTLDGSWAYWKVTVNPNGYTLGGGKDLTLADTFHDGVTGDAAQSIDYASVAVQSGGNVTYDYSGNTGTFVIPDSTPVTITYRTRITAQPGEAVLFRGTAVLKNSAKETIASSTAGVTEQVAVIYPSASDVGGLGTNYMVKMFVYPENNMQQGIEGAQFILLDANQRPLEYKVGDNKDQPVTFTTGSDGYVNIELNEEPGDVSIEKNTGYYLEMIQAVEGYQKDNTLYSFMITDDPSYSSGGFYKYYNGDTMKVRLYPKTPGLSVSIRFSGSYSLTEEQQNDVTAVLQKQEGEGNWVEVERHPYTDSQWGAITFEEKLYDPDLGDYQNIYRVVVENQHPWDLPESIVVETTYYCLVNTASDDPHKEEPQEFILSSADDSVSVVIDNRYEEPQLTLIKMDKQTGETLSGAEFSVYKIVEGHETGDPLITYTTKKEEGNQVVIRGGEPYESETLYGIKETNAPENYLLPQEDEWYYFYFCNDEYLEPSILANLPKGATAINLTETGDVLTIDNQKEEITIPVMKIWQGGVWPEGKEVEIGLYKSVEGSGVVEPVLNDDDSPKTVTLTAAMPYNNEAFNDLPSRTDDNKNIIYSIKEESIDGEDPLNAGYNQEYGVSSAGVYIVRNKPATKLTVSKEWYDEDGNKIEDSDILAEQSPVTFDVYRTTEPYSKDENITNAEMTAFVSSLELVREKVKFGTNGVWIKEISDLDYQNDLGQRYYYYILEYIPSFGNEKYDVNKAEGKITIKNIIAPQSVDLTVTKAPLVDDPRPESLDRYFTFTLKLQKDDAHPIRSWQVYTDSAHPENNLVTDEKGEVKFMLKPTDPDHQPTLDASITLSLPRGVTATVTEEENSEYTVATNSTVTGTTADDGRTFSYETTSEAATLTYTNTLHVICKVVQDNGVQIPFESLKSALAWIHSNLDDFTAPWTIYLLEDYTIPVTDMIEVGEDESLILTTATTDETDLFPFKPKPGGEPDRATITRGGNGGSMLKSAGTLTLDNICLDGNKDHYTANQDGGLVNSTGILNLNDNTTLRNSATSGKGGAVYAEGTVNIVSGVAISGNSAPNASAIYLKGTLNMTGGSITENTGAADGAVVVETTSDVINLSGDPIIFDNTNPQGKAANLYIGVDSDNAVNVVTPGLASNAKIGVSAMDGHMLIGEQFATAEFEQTANLNRFVNDVYGYRGKLKEGTSTNIVWDGLKIKIKKIVEATGANPNDRFTITLASSSIIMSTYIIDGTLDYTVTAARLNRPGTIELRNVKADDEISISPLPVGTYTITENAPNYSQTYTVQDNEDSGTEPEPISNGVFYVDNDSTVTVKNTRKLANVNLTKTLEDRLESGAVDFGFTVQLTEADGTAVSGFPLKTDGEGTPVSGFITNEHGEVSFTMSPTDTEDVTESFRAPVGATMTITETVNPNYEITASAETMPKEGEGEAITDLDEDHDNIFKFAVTKDGADVTFNNERKMAHIELSKTLNGKVSKEESFEFTLTLTNQDRTPVVNYLVYRDELHPEKNIKTDDNGVAKTTFTFGQDETDPKSITLTIPEGIKLVVAETEVKKVIDGTERAIYNTSYSKNGGASVTGLTATMNSVSDSDHSIAFTNNRKTNTITVKNTVNGYPGNVQQFTYTATVTDGGEDQDDYDENGFTNGVMTFELTAGQTRVLTVPYGATLTVAETYIVGYETKVKRGGAAEVSNVLSDTFVVTTNMASGSPLLFTNNQLIGLQLVNNTSSTLENVTVTVGDGKKIYLVNENKDGQTPVGTKTATLSIASGVTAILEIQHTTTTTAEQDYTVQGQTPASDYYYTIVNEPSFHEYANPAVLHIYNVDNYTLKGKLRYSVKDSTVTFNEDPLVSFDSNGGEWTSSMEGYNDRDDDQKVYQKYVKVGDTVERPTDPVYPTAEGFEILGWTTDEAFAKESHTAGEDISAKAYNFNNPVTVPITLYAVWSKPARNKRVVTVKNSTENTLNVSLALTNSSRIGNITIVDSENPDNRVITDSSGNAFFVLRSGVAINLSIPDRTKIALSAKIDSSEVFWDLAVSSEFDLAASADHKTFTINSVDRDGTVTFIPGICKITDAAGNVLYNSSGEPAVYDWLSRAFLYYDTPLYDDSHAPATPAAVKMLVDEYEIESNTITFPKKTMTLTTAGKDDEDFPFIGMQDRATLYRNSYTAGSLFKTPDTISGTNYTITFTDIILDGRDVKVSADFNGGLIYFDKANATLNIGTGTTMRNVAFANYDNTNNSRGGAIYIKNGTLNVTAGVFSNLKARHGGAICAESNASLNVTGRNGSIVFEKCTTDSNNENNDGGDGGAIYYSASNPLSIDGGSDNGISVDDNGIKTKLNNPGIIFNSCVAGSLYGDGGAVYVSANTSVIITGCEFLECSCKMDDKNKSDKGFGGGAIGVKNVKSLKASYCRFTECDSMISGGAIMGYVKTNDEGVSVENCVFERCSCKAQGGAVAVYQDNNGATGSSTKLTVKNTIIENCSSGTSNGSGGAVQCYLPCMDFISSTFTDCWAGKEGGAVNNYFGGNYVQVWSNSSMTVDDCRFIRCRAEDRYEPTALQHYGGGINTKVKTVTVTNSTFEDCVSTLKEGGALHIGGQGDGSTATITGSTFKNCSAKNGGGAVLSSHETLIIDDCNFYGCSSSASNGGAVYHYRNSRGDSTQKYTTITNSTFSATPGVLGSEGCSAGQNGGAIWTRATTGVTLENLTISDCTAGNQGGAVYLNSTVTAAKLTGGSISGSKAVQGSAVYVGSQAQATFSGSLSVSENVVSDINSGAIHGEKLYFEGNVKVQDNTCSSDSDYDHDVLMQNDNVTTIYTTKEGLGQGANIGVYVPDNNFDKHGLEGTPFGTYDNTTTAGSNYLESFFNDRDSELYGYQLTADDTKIYWGSFICKITDSAGNTLIRPNGRDAVYPRLTQALDEFILVTGGDAVYIKMLVENYAIRQDNVISNFPEADVTLTTETYTGDEPVEGKYDGKHPYRGTEGTVCTISRSSGNTMLFNLNNGNAIFQLENITLDGRNDKTTGTGNRKLLKADAGELIVNRGTTFKYGVAGMGGAIEALEDARVTINGEYDADENEPTVMFVNCSVATGTRPKGGAIWAVNLNIYNNTEEQGKYGTVFINCTAYNGGAINSTGSSMEINGVFFDTCQTQSGGGAIYHDNSAENTTTTVRNCAFENCLTNGTTWAHGGALEARTATLNVEDSSFRNCHATSDGGAVYHGFVNNNNLPLGNREKTSIKYTTFEGCYTTGTDTGYSFGGSVYTQAKTVEVIDSSIKNSSASNYGGAIYCQTSVDGSAATISGTSIENCSVSRSGGNGGAIYSRNKTLTLNSFTPEGAAKGIETSINDCTAPGYSGAVHMETTGSTLNITDGTMISGCYADKGGAIYLPAGVIMNLTGSPDFVRNGYTTQNGSTIDATAGACIYLEEDSTINLSGSPKFSRNILPTKERIANGGITDFVRQDIYMAGYASSSPLATNAASICVVGELTGDTIWIWPEMSPHKLPNEQFAKIKDGVTVSEESLSHLRNALGDDITHCSNGEYLAGVQLNASNKNIYWDKMYTISFKKIDNKGVTVPEAEFTLYKGIECTPLQFVAKAVSADGETDTDSQGNLLPRGTVEFTSIRIGAFYMKETKEPTSFKENDTTYLVLVGTPYLSPNEDNKDLWENGGPLDVDNAATLVARYTTDAGKYYGIFPLDANNKAILRANLASNNVGIENIRNDYQAWFMKLDENGDALPGAAFTIYTSILDGEGNPMTFDDGYPMLTRWSRDGETYPAPVESADGTDKYKDIDNHRLPKGLVYFRELPLGTYYLLETGYPDRNGRNRHAFYKESDRLLRLVVLLDENTEEPGFTIEEVKYNTGTQKYDIYEKLPTNTSGYQCLSNTDVVCKLTDNNNNLLYVEGQHEVWDTKGEGEKRLFPAIYHTLEEGFAAAQTGTLVDANHNTVAGGDLNPPLKLQSLKDYNLKDPVVYNSSRNLTFTTASTHATSTDRYIFSTTRTSDTSRALIKRAYNADTSADANAGALITVSNDANLTLQNINFNGQKTYYNGRAIHVTNGSLTIYAYTQFQNFRQEAAADSTDENNIRGGAILMEDNTSLKVDGGQNRSVVFSNNNAINRRESGTVGASGGAIAIGKNCTVEYFRNAQFTGNKAQPAVVQSGNGGAIFVDGTGVSESQTVLPLEKVVFTSNIATNSGGALYTSEGCNVELNNCTFTGNQAKNGDGGAVAVLSRTDAQSAVVIKSGSDFTRNKAPKGNGGAVDIGEYGNLRLENVTIGKNKAENTAKNGGAIGAESGSAVVFASGTLENNKATQNGGAIYAESGSSVTVMGGTAKNNTATQNGGAIYGEAGSTTTVTGGTLESNTAQKGSAVYAKDSANITITGGSITGNKASASDSGGGAINVGGDNARIFFGGDPFVFDNFGTTDTSQQRNVVLSANTNSIINTTTDGMGDSGLIGIYAIDGSDTFMDHGLPGKPFGTFGDTATHANPQVFRNDRNLALYGVKKENDLIYWMDVICKLTDSDDNLLYRDVSIKIKDKDVSYKAPAVYYTLPAGFEAAQGTIYTSSGSTYTNDKLKLKMLKDAELTDTIPYNGTNREVTLTTAETNLTDPMKEDKNYYLFSTNREGADGRALISRGFDDNSMITVNGKKLTLNTIVLDGKGNEHTTSANGGIMNVNSGSALSIETDAALRNSKTSGQGGAVYAASNTNVTMSGGTISGNTATEKDGGAIYAAGGSNVAITGGTISGNTASAGDGGAIYAAGSSNVTMSGGTISGNTASAGDGGAIYAADSSNVTMSGGTISGNTATAGSGGAMYLADGAAMTLSGNPAINGNTAETAGAGIYLNEGATLRMEGNPDFGGADVKGGTGSDKDDILSENGNFLNGDLSGKTNGQKTYTRPRQDIFLAGYLGKISQAEDATAKPATGIILTGNITSGAGTIWIWAEKPSGEQPDNHYEMLKQFAVVEAGKTINTATMEAFRNAMDDESTGCGADYLTGQSGETMTDANGNTWTCIYWTGGFDFLFKKIDSFGNALDGATFTLYKSNEDGDGILEQSGAKVAFEKSGEAVTATSAEITAAKAVTIKVKTGTAGAETAEDKEVYGDALVHFEKIPPGTYFLIETTYPAISNKEGAPKYVGAQSDAANETVYKIVMNGKGWFDIYVPAGFDSSKKQIWKKAGEEIDAEHAFTTLFVKGSDGKYTAPTSAITPTSDTMEIYTIMNLSPFKHKVILTKAAKGKNTPLAGAQFRIFRSDLSEVKNSDYKTTGGVLGYVSLASGVYFIDTLPEGKYYLVETAVPTGAATTNLGKVFTLEVKDGTQKIVETDQTITVNNNLISNLRDWLG